MMLLLLMIAVDSVTSSDLTWLNCLELGNGL